MNDHDNDFQVLVENYYEGLFRFALSLTHKEAEASDLTQQTFYLWATKGHQLRDKSKVKSWLFTTLYREFLGSKRRESRFPHYEVDAVTPELPSIAPQQVDTLDGNMIVNLLEQVDEIYRAPLVLFYLKQHSYAEIAEALDIPAGTVMSRLSRGKAQLRGLISKESTADSQRKVVSVNFSRPNSSVSHE